eukprot:jgi/Bigna1/137655/aug1.40_g12363
MQRNRGSWVPLGEILSWRKLSKITTSMAEVQRAIAKDPLLRLKLSTDRKMLRRSPAHLAIGAHVGILQSDLLAPKQHRHRKDLGHDCDRTSSLMIGTFLGRGKNSMVKIRFGFAIAFVHPCIMHVRVVGPDDCVKYISFSDYHETKDDSKLGEYWSSSRWLDDDESSDDQKIMLVERNLPPEVTRILNSAKDIMEETEGNLKIAFSTATKALDLMKSCGRVEDEKNPAEILIVRAEIAMRDGKLAAAKTDMETLIRLRNAPDIIMHKAYYILSTALEKENNFAQAKKELSRAIAKAKLIGEEAAEKQYRRLMSSIQKAADKKEKIARYDAREAKKKKNAMMKKKKIVDNRSTTNKSASEEKSDKSAAEADHQLFNNKENENPPEYMGLSTLEKLAGNNKSEISCIWGQHCDEDDIGLDNVDYRWPSFPLKEER